jgi:hypothetical protein
MIKKVDDSDGIICRGFKKISYQRWCEQEQTDKGVQFISGGTESVTGVDPDFTISEVQTEDSDEKKPPYHWSKHGTPGSAPVAKAFAFSRTRQSVMSNIKDETADLTSPPVDSAIGADQQYIDTPVSMEDDEDGRDIDTIIVLSDVDIKKVLAQDGAGGADHEASGVPAGSSHLVLNCTDNCD